MRKYGSYGLFLTFYYDDRLTIHISTINDLTMPTSTLLINLLHTVQTARTLHTTTKRLLSIPHNPPPHASHPAPRCHRHRLLIFHKHKSKIDTQRNDSLLLQHRNPPPFTNNHIQCPPTLRDSCCTAVLWTVSSPFTRSHSINGKVSTELFEGQ